MRLKEIGDNPVYEDELEVLEQYAELLRKQDRTKAKRKASEAALHKKIDAKYPKLSDAEVKALVIEDKWLSYIRARVEGELDRVSLRLTDRIHEIARRYWTPLPTLTQEVAALTQRVEDHLKRMGASWQ